MRRPAQPVPSAPFGDRRLPLLPPPTNGNRHSQPASWITPSQINEEFPNTEGEDQGGETPEADHCRELHSRVQSRSGDTCPQVCHVMNQNVQGLTGGYKLEKTIDIMITRGIHGYYLQDMCLLRTFSRTIRGDLLLHKGMATKPCHRGRASSCVSIILGPALLWAWDMADKSPPITSASSSDFSC